MQCFEEEAPWVTQGHRESLGSNSLLVLISVCVCVMYDCVFACVWAQTHMSMCGVPEVVDIGSLSESLLTLFIEADFLS